MAAGGCDGPTGLSVGGTIACLAGSVGEGDGAAGAAGVSVGATGAGGLAGVDVGTGGVSVAIGVGDGAPAGVDVGTMGVGGMVAVGVAVGAAVVGVACPAGMMRIMPLSGCTPRALPSRSVRSTDAIVNADWPLDALARNWTVKMTPEPLTGSVGLTWVTA